MSLENLTQAVEDYLKTLYELTSTHGRATTTQIAEALKVKPASATGMVQKLAGSDPPLVQYEKYHGVTLTPEGEKAALEIIRHHRLLERFLHETLGFPWDEVHDEACKLEHYISEDFEDRMAEILGDPSHDPHGDPIPTRDLKMPRFTTTRLAELKAGQKAVVKRVQDSDSALLRHLGNLGVIPGTLIEVAAYSPFDQNLTLKLIDNDEPIVLGPRITNEIYVEVVT